jgi:hypothetical protein
MRLVRIAGAVALLAATVLATPDLTGYSGAPGSGGSCASTCHGVTGGTIAVVGFPTVYTPGQSYTISVVHVGDSSICNFNASVRADSDSVTAGTITAGYLTETYAVTGEPNGVHLASQNHDSCTFVWQAPSPGVGVVRLYMAGLQSSSMDGPNTSIILVAAQSAIGEGRVLPRPPSGLRLEPSVAARHAAVRITVSAGPEAGLRVIDRGGKLVARISVPASATDRSLFWNLTGSDGRGLATGTYFVILAGPGERLMHKLVIR